MSTEWAELFTVFEQSLKEWLTRAVGPPSGPAPHPTEPAALRLFEERLKRLQTYLDKAEQDAEQAVAPLSTDIEALQQWLAALNTARAKLVQCGARSVSEIGNKSCPEQSHNAAA
jgi:16S rRNA U1498 N3-methylase RsmE